MEANRKNELFFGRLGRDPELTYSPRNEAICRLNVAINNKEEETIWKKVTVWGDQAVICNDVLKKGMPIFVEGQSTKEKYKSKDGVEKTFEETFANHVGVPCS